MTTRKQHLPDIPSGCTYELIVAVKSWRTSMQASTKQNFSIEREDGNKVYQLAKEILSIYSCWERESQLFLRVRPLVGLWTSIGRSHISEYGATKIVLDVSFSFLPSRMDRNGWNWKELEEGVYMVNTLYMDFSLGHHLTNNDVDTSY